MTATVVDDINAYVLTGRVPDTSRVFSDAEDAERLGFKRLFMAERYDVKEAGALLGGIAARTSRIEVGTGGIIPQSRSPLMTAALGATMQTAYGPRFNLGLARGNDSFLKGQGVGQTKWPAYADYVDIVRRLWAGETVSYDGVLGRYDSLKLVDQLEGPPPMIWVLVFGGPIGCRRAAELGDGVLLAPFLTPEAAGRAVTAIRTAREERDLDPAIPICQPIVTAPDMDEETTLRLTGARLVTYLQLPDLGETYLKLNRWDREPVERIQNFRFDGMDRPNVDQSFHLTDLMEPAKLVPEEWVTTSAAVGSADECVKMLQSYRDAGIDELAIYGSDPGDNAGLIEAWRRR